MRYRPAQIALLMACLFAGNDTTHAQYPISRDVTVTCPSFHASAEQHSGSTISIVEVRFSGVLHLPVSDQEEIAASIKEIRGSSVDAVREEALEHAKQGWENRGYMKVRVTGEVEALTSSPAGQQVAFSAYVDEALRYTLGEITFKNNKAIRAESLRSLIPVKDGDIFSREKMAKGIENLRSAYGEAGYLNYTGVPDTKFDDERKIINIDFDVDEGKQFFVSSIDILGLDEHSRQEILKEYPIAQVYNQRLFGLFVERHFDVLKMHHDDPRLVVRHLDERKGTVAITLYACPCSVC